eukprot:scaffold634110_cov22-Prasinocladus_malaysianus.AAC.1
MSLPQSITKKPSLCSNVRKVRFVALHASSRMQHDVRVSHLGGYAMPCITDYDIQHCRYQQYYSLTFNATCHLVDMESQCIRH